MTDASRNTAEHGIGGAQLSILRSDRGWSDAVIRLVELYQRGGAGAEEAASTYASRYDGRRAVMVFDVVHSANRRYDQVVRPRVERFERTSAAQSLRHLADEGPPPTTGFKRYEAAAMRSIAASLADYCDERNLDDDEGCRHWAEGPDPGVLHLLDPVIGYVKGVGLTLYRYLRMRSGADDIKPDRRVANGLQRLGFPRFRSPAHTYVLAHAAAIDAQMRPLVLDQLLWLQG